MGFSNGRIAEELEVKNGEVVFANCGYARASPFILTKNPFASAVIASPERLGSC